MNTFKQRLLTNWHPMRMIKLVFGIWAGVQAIQVHEMFIGIFSVFFLYQAIFDAGCCGTQSCYAPPVKKKADSTDVTEYEEIK